MEKFLVKNIKIQNAFKDAYVSDILIEDGKIVQIAENITSDSVRLLDGTNKTISFGLVDRHTHGGYGCNFNTCNEEELQNYLVNARKHGIVAVLPTIMTDDIENINKQIKLIQNTKSKGAKVLGIHLEGVFINSQKKGIHPAEYILTPTIENLNKLKTDFIKILTFAPELDKDLGFLAELKKRNIIPSIGHSCASLEQATTAVKSGVAQFTHLFNALPQIHHRKPSCVVEALNNDDIAVEIIADLEHLHASIVQLVLKTKPKDKILFISDALPISYSSQTEACFGGQKIYYNGVQATSQDGVLAGSTLFLDDIYKKVEKFIDFKDFLGYASLNIARSIGHNEFDEIKVGTEFADLHIWDFA